MIMSFTPVNGIISYLRRIFRNTQMEVLNLVLVYLQNLMHADVQASLQRPLSVRLFIKRKQIRFGLMKPGV